MMLPLQGTAKPSSLLLETSPFKGLWGQSAFRAEHQLHENISAGYMLEKIHLASEREATQDHSLSLATELIWYLPSGTIPSFFVSLGIKGEREVVGRLARNPYHRFGSSTAQDKYTTWIQRNDYLSLHQSLGMRFYSSYFWTASFKFLADELVTQSSSIESIEGDLSTAEKNMNIRPLTKFNLVLHVGLWLP